LGKSHPSIGSAKLPEASLIATAVERRPSAVLVSNERAFDAYAVKRLWRWAP
jgi:hypothetical protein